MGNCLGRRNRQSKNNRAYDRLANPKDSSFKGPPPEYTEDANDDDAHAIVEVCLL